MLKDLSPEDISAQARTASDITLDEAARLEDVGAQPGPEDLTAEAVGPAAAAAATELSPVKWPASEDLAPDFRYLADQSVGDDFELTPDVLDHLVTVNRYEPYRDKDVMAFALRGAQLRNGHEIERANTVPLRQATPDHKNFRCVLGFYYLGDRRLTAFTGSTVPCRRAIYGYKHGGAKSNMLPTGLYPYYVWRHKSIRPALRLAKSSGDPESGAPATVLRNTNNYELEVTDPFNYSEPLDNVHCSYYLDEQDYEGAYFSSWGCLTVRGRKSPASDQWKKFQQVLDSLGERTRVDLLLATGKDAATAASANGNWSLVDERLTALRFGSRGAEVSRLQTKLGTDATGYFGAATLDKLTGRQRVINDAAGHGRIADGIYTTQLDALTGWGVFSDQHHV